MLALQASAAEPQAPPVLEQLLACRKLENSAERLACFDRQTATFETARSRREVVVVDRQQIRSTQRSLFGLTLPRIPFLDGKDDSADAVPSEIEAVVKSIRVTRDGKWVVGLDNEATWQTTDVSAFDTPPKVGAKVKVRRAALGSFVLAVEGKRALRAIRLR
jgi:hypothetical protein